MKPLKVILIITACIIAASCTRDTIEPIEANFALVDFDQNPISGQLPNEKYDHTQNGLYHGIIASAANMSRGKIWVNLSNDGQYNALVQMVDGQKMYYSLHKQASNINEHFYVFKNDISTFEFDVSNLEQPTFTNVSILSEPFYATAIKGTNGRMPFSFTGIFRETVPGSPFAGTWNLISTGVPAPEGFGYETISAAMVTFNSNMFTDTTSELFNYPCVSNPAFNPQMGSVPGNTNAVIAHAQTSYFNGTTSWDLGTGNGLYFNSACGSVTYGTFSWTSAATGVTKNGLILID